MKDGKATGPGEIPAEALKTLDEEDIEMITALCNIIYNTRMIPTDMKHLIFATLPMKSKEINCTEFRTISRRTENGVASDFQIKT